MPSINSLWNRTRKRFRQTRDSINTKIRQFNAALANAADPSRYYYLGPELALTKLKHGYFLYIDPLDETVSANLIAHGCWEEWVHRVVKNLIRPGDVTVEVGANLGYYTIQMARSAGTTGKVISFEANPRMVDYLNRSIMLNGYTDRVQVVAKAATDAPGQLSFMTSRRYGGSGHLMVPESGIAEDQQVVTVEAVRLDDLNLGKVDLLRMDAEGSEPLILRGAERLLRNPDIVICMEWSPIQMRSRGSVPELVEWLAAQGFRFWSIEPTSTLRPIPKEQMADLTHCDVVVSRKPPRPRTRRVQVIDQII